MDEIIYLETDEEITSVVDKIKNAKNINIGLVVPREATILQSVVNLRLLSKEAGALGKNISIVTADKIGRNLAAQVGLPVFASVREQSPAYIPPQPKIDHDEILEVENEKTTPPLEPVSHQRGVNVHHFQETRPVVHWKTNRKPEFSPPPELKSHQKPQKQMRHPIIYKILWPILAAIAILMIGCAYLLWPSATVKVFLKADNLEKSVPVVFTNAISAADISQNAFPGVVIEASQEKSEKFVTTGKKDLGGKASGTVTFTNGLDSLSHKFAAGSKLIASNKTYLLKNTVTVPGATVQNLKVVPGTVTAQIEAENAGEDYNIKAAKLTIVGIPTNQQQALFAEATSDIKGGFTKVVSVVSKDDYENAKNKLIEELSTKLDQDLETKANGLEIIEKSANQKDPEITTSSNIDQEAQDFEIKVQLQKQVMAYNFDGFQNFLVSSLGNEIESGKMVIIPTKEDFGFTIDKIAFDKGEVDLTANIQAKIVDKIDINQLKTKIMGKSQKVAEAVVLSEPGASKVEFQFNPNWWSRLSVLNKNINIEVNFLSE